MMTTCFVSRVCVLSHTIPELRVVPIQNLKPDVLMMESAEGRDRCDATELLYLPKIWSIFIQIDMGTDLIRKPCLTRKP